MVFSVAVKIVFFFPTHITLFISIEYHLQFYHQLLSIMKPSCNLNTLGRSANVLYQCLDNLWAC